MTTDRCPACSAAVTPGAPWCTLCYADLRPAPVAPVAPALAELSLPAAESVVVSTLPPHPILDAPVHTRPVMAAPGWPCRSCGTTVALAEDACPTCGTTFLEPDAGVSLHLPGVGDVTKLEKPQRVGLIIGGMAGMTVLFVVLAFLLGMVF